MSAHTLYIHSCNLLCKSSCNSQMHEAWTRLYGHNNVSWCYVMPVEAHTKKTCTMKVMKTVKEKSLLCLHSISVASDFFLQFTITSFSLSRSLLLYCHAVIVPLRDIINCIIASPAPTEAPQCFFFLSFFPPTLPLPIKPSEF